MELYVSECENSSEDPVSVIIRGHLPGESEELYYRVMLIKSEWRAGTDTKEPSLYVSILQERFSYGQPTLEAAYSGSHEQCGFPYRTKLSRWKITTILAVDQTSVVYNDERAGKTAELEIYTVRQERHCNYRNRQAGLCKRPGNTVAIIR